MELVYPIYLDIPMMMGFLASLEGGILEEAEMESKSGDSKEKSASISLKANVSSILSTVLGAEAGGSGSKKVTENIESSYKGIVRYPTSALFIRLRNLLIEQKMLVPLASSSDFDTLNLGDIIEFSGYVTANPLYQIRRAVKQLLPIVEASTKISGAQLEHEIITLDNVKPGDKVTILDQEIIIKNKKHSISAQDLIRSQQRVKQNESDLYHTIGEILDNLFSHEGTDLLLFEARSWQAISRVYPNFIRNEQVHEIHNANWRCIGKIIGFVSENEKYDLLKGSPIGYLAKEHFAEIAASLQNEKMQIEINEPIIKGPAIILATMAIFA